MLVSGSLRRRKNLPELIKPKLFFAPNSKIERSFLKLLHLDTVNPSSSIEDVNDGYVVPNNGEKVHLDSETNCHFLEFLLWLNHFPFKGQPSLPNDKVRFKIIKSVECIQNLP